MELTRSDHPFINTLQVGDYFDGYFVLRSFQIGTTKSAKPYLTLDFTDRTGHIRGKLWDDATQAYRGLEEGQIVKIRAVVTEYQGALDLNVKKIRIVAEEDLDGDFSRFLPVAEHDLLEDWKFIESTVENMEHEGLKKLCLKVMEDEELSDAFRNAPAGKKWHHGYLGGLLEHTASMMGLAVKICNHYTYLNKELLITGCLFHDIGKLEELTYKTAIDYSAKGRLIGHIVLGARLIEELSQDIDELDESTKTLLIHLVLSHQGEYEHGCPVIPMTREAFVLYYIDEIDSKLNAINRELAKAEGGGGDFTDHIRLLGRMLYKG